MSLSRFASWSLVALFGGVVFACSGGESSSGSSTSGASSSSGAGGEAGSGGSGGGSSSSSSSTGGPIMCTDYGNVPETSCSLIHQDCGLGEACRPNAAGTGTNCEKGAGVKGPGADCTENNECAVGQYCVFNHCAPICCKDAASAFCGNAPCSVEITFGSKKLYTCNFAKSCTLFANDCPQEPFVYECHYDPGQQIATCATNSDAHVPEGGMCMFINDCGNNMVCMGNLCRNSCLLANWMSLEPGQGGCPAPQKCVAYPNGGADIGVCQP